MKLSLNKKELMRAHIIEQLARFNYYDVENLSFDELLNKLAYFRAFES